MIKTLIFYILRKLIAFGAMHNTFPYLIINLLGAHSETAHTVINVSFFVYSRNDFFTIIDLPEGIHEYKYFVDGEWVCDNKQVCIHAIFINTKSLHSMPIDVYTLCGFF